MAENKNVERPTPNVQRSIQNQPFVGSVLSVERWTFSSSEFASPQPPSDFCQDN